MFFVNSPELWWGIPKFRLGSGLYDSKDKYQIWSLQFRWKAWDVNGLVPPEHLIGVTNMILKCIPCVTEDKKVVAACGQVTWCIP